MLEVIYIIEIHNVLSYALWCNVVCTLQWCKGDICYNNKLNSGDSSETGGFLLMGGILYVLGTSGASVATLRRRRSPDFMMS